MLFLRFASFLLSSLVLYAQQTSVVLKVHSTNFPKGCVFKIDTKLKFFVVDTKKMIAEQRRNPTAGDCLLEYISTNSFDWNISYNSSQKPIIKQSPASVAFAFDHPLIVLNNAMAFIKLEGQGELRNNGKTKSILLSQVKTFQANTAYVLRLNYIEATKDEIVFGVGLMTEQEFQISLDEQSDDKKFSGVIRLSRSQVSE